jgi:hypothetical protein
MSFDLLWTDEARATFERLEQTARRAATTRRAKAKKKSSRQEGLFKQVAKAIGLLQENPRHPGLNTHEYDSLPHPYDDTKKVFETYAQNRTSGAYRVFWCYGPNTGDITIIAITPHP